MWDRGQTSCAQRNAPLHLPSRRLASLHFRCCHHTEEAANPQPQPQLKTQAIMQCISRIVFSLLVVIAVFSLTRAMIYAAEEDKAAELLQSELRRSNDTPYEVRSDVGDVSATLHPPADNSNELRAATVLLKNCVPADQEPWIATVKAACVFFNPTSGFTYFYKLNGGRRFRNCFCNNDGASGFQNVFKENALTSKSKKNAWCYIKGLKRTWILPDMKSDFAYAFEPFEERPECE